MSTISKGQQRKELIYYETPYISKYYPQLIFLANNSYYHSLSKYNNKNGKQITTELVF